MKTSKLLRSWGLEISTRRRNDRQLEELKDLSIASIIERYKGKNNQLPDGALLELYKAGRLADIIALTEKMPSKIRRRLSDVNAEGDNLFHLIAQQSKRPYYDAAITLWPIMNKLDCDPSAWLNVSNLAGKTFYRITQERGVNDILGQLNLLERSFHYLPFFDRAAAGMNPPSVELSSVNPS